MTIMPFEVPLWCWCLQGDDAVYFSQPSLAWLSGTLQDLTDRPACVARCQETTQFVLDDFPVDPDPDAPLTPPIQCGKAASLDPQGRWFCWYHWHTHWGCARCDAALPHGEGGYCGPCTVQAVDEDPL